MSTDPQRLGKYELHERLGQSGMTEVWKAYDTQLHRYVAIKFLHVNLQEDPDFVTRFQREAQAIVSLRYPNIVQYYDFSVSQRTGGITAYIVMDYVEAGTLSTYIHTTSRQGKFPPAVDIIRLFTSIGMAVDYAHQRGVIHGNIKPANILLDKRGLKNLPDSPDAMGEPLVTDFGVAKLLGVTAGGTSAWRIGAPFYISPEQVMGSPADERSDIYSLGIMLYEICTGTLPFQGNNPGSIMMQHVNTIPASPALINPNLPPALISVIMRSIAKDPAARFPTAASLVAALVDASRQGKQDAFNRPVPENVDQPAYSVSAMDMPTMRSTRLSPLPTGMAPSSLSSLSPSASISGGTAQTPPRYSMAPFHNAVEVSSPERSSMNMQMVGSSQPHEAVSVSGPIHSMSPTFLPGQSAQNLPAPPHAYPVSPSSHKPRRRGLWITLSALLVLLVVGGSLGAYFAFFSKSAPPKAPASTIAGHAYFFSSGLLSANPESNQGITDKLQIKLDNIPPPPVGKSYYAWLLNDKTLEWNPIPLGKLTVDNGTVDLTYPGDPQHSNLLATNSRFFITEEDAGVTPVNPSQDPGALLYYAEFSQIPNPADPNHYSLYDHIRHMLANDPKVKAAGLTGGLDIWLYRNTQKILEWAGSARDAQQSGAVAFIRRQLTRILDYLDGTYYIQQDLPGQNLLVDQTIAKIGLLTFDPQTQNPPGYVYHVGKHLREVTSLPQSTPQQKALADQINQALNVVGGWFQTIRLEALQLYHMTDAQLVGNQARNLLNDMATLANEAFVGKVSPNAQVIDGVVQVHYDIQRLATFNIQACTANSPCPALA